MSENKTKEPKEVAQKTEREKKNKHEKRGKEAGPGMLKKQMKGEFFRPPRGFLAGAKVSENSRGKAMSEPKEVDTQSSKRPKERERKNTFATGKKGRGS